MENDIALFTSIGLSEQKAKETLKNLHVTKNLKCAIEEVLKHGALDSIKGILLYHLACNIRTQIKNQIPFLTRYIISQKIDSIQKLDYALNYLLDYANEIINIEAFENACGVGITVMPEEIENAVELCINKYKKEIIDKRYRFNTGIVMQEVRSLLKWADGKNIKNELDIQFFDLLGPKTEKDFIVALEGPKHQDAGKNTEKVIKDKVTKCTLRKNPVALTICELMKSKVQFHKPGENFKTEGYIITPNTKKLLNEHLLQTGNKVRTRFPPEPNGILHIGHAKAININFGYAEAYNGLCFLRYDDTNPEKEEEKFVNGILDIVQWLGYTPAKVTYSSNYFESLFKYAVALIKMDLAYVCHQSSSEIKGFNPLPSPWRNRPISENLAIFQDMKDGLLDEGDATLRMKVTLEEGKQDPVAYRIKFSPHHKTMYKWCIYPTYDFTHCLCDSIENISHSLCTKEFQSRRSSYYWLCNALDIYCPVQWEYGRLNVSYTVVSKRKIAKLIDKKIVRDWDDPRLFTLSALRRRGFPSKAINNFCAQMGVTGAQGIVDPTALEAAVRDNLNNSATRHMVVLDPIKITIDNFPCNKPISIEVPNFPGDNSKGHHLVIFDRIVYIESSDFQEADVKNFKRLSLNQSVGLKYAGVVLSIKKVERNIHNSIVNIIVNQVPVTEQNKPKAFIQWVCQPSLVNVHLYENLFHHRNPEDIHVNPRGFLSDINYNSKKDLYAYIDTNIRKTMNPLDKFQFERIGFFTVDPDSKHKKMIFNRTVKLKD